MLSIVLLFDIMAKYNPLTFETKYEQVKELKQKANTLRPRGVYTGPHKILNRQNLAKILEPREPCKFLNGQQCCNLSRNLHRNSSVHKFVRIRVNRSLSPTGKALRDETMARETTQTGSEVLFPSTFIQSSFTPVLLCME